MKQTHTLFLAFALILVGSGSVAVAQDAVTSTSSNTSFPAGTSSTTTATSPPSTPPSTQINTGINTEHISFSAQPTSGKAPLTVTFSGSDGGAVFSGGIRVGFGDSTSVFFCEPGTICGQKTLTHLYTEAGTYTVKLVGMSANNYTPLGSVVITVFPREIPAIVPATISVTPVPLATTPAESPVIIPTTTTNFIATTSASVSVPDYASAPRDLVGPVSQITPEPTRPMQTEIIAELRAENALRASGERLEQVSKNVRRFEQAVTEHKEPPIVVPNPTNNIQDVTDAPKVAATIETLRERGGLDMYTDTDHDGISDYDEKNVYGTDPKNAHTAHDTLTDGQRVLLGFDVHSTSTVRVPVESPIDAGTVSQTIFEVTVIRTQTIPLAPASITETIQEATSSNTKTSADQKQQIPESNPLVFEGRSLPNSFVTLYIYSTPVVVTVKTDDSGNWRYALDTELPDGKHTLYVAMVNNDGRIIAKSSPVPFVKQAEAVDFIPLVIPPVAEPSFIDTLRDNMLVAGGVLALIFGGIVVAFMGLHHKPEDMGTAA